MKKIMTILFVEQHCLSFAQEHHASLWRWTSEIKMGYNRSENHCIRDSQSPARRLSFCKKWNVLLIFRNIRKIFCKTLKLTPSIHKIPNGASVGIQPIQWVKEKQKQWNVPFHEKLADRRLCSLNCRAFSRLNKTGIPKRINFERRSCSP